MAGFCELSSANWAASPSNVNTCPVMPSNNARYAVG
jgi:hypothetical protein